MSLQVYLYPPDEPPQYFELDMRSDYLEHLTERYLDDIFYIQINYIKVRLDNVRITDLPIIPCPDFYDYVQTYKGEKPENIIEVIKYTDYNTPKYNTIYVEQNHQKALKIVYYYIKKRDEWGRRPGPFKNTFHKKFRKN